MRYEADLVVIGAGPAGMAASRMAAELGLSVILLDEQRRPGGQIYRDVERAVQARGDILGQDYSKGLELTKGLEHPAIQHMRGAVVWQIENLSNIAFTVDDVVSLAVGRRILLATGALERPMPLRGWTLPGVMTAGAAQILLKQSGMVAEHAIIAGSGPLLYLIAAQMCRAGRPPVALVETQSIWDFVSALRYGFGALKGRHYLTKGLKLLAEIRRAGVRRYVGAADLAVVGEHHAEGLSFTSAGRRHAIASSTILLHHGVGPNTQAARSIDVPHRWNALQQAFEPVCDPWGRTAHKEVFVAGDGAGIGGADAAAIAGRISAIEIAKDLGALSSAERDERAVSMRRALAKELAARPFIDRAYPPYKAALLPADDTIVCRCEEVTAGDVRRFARLGCLGPNQAKAFGRQGMGPCQGRYCGLAVTALLAQANSRSEEETGYYRIRPPIKPVTLDALAAYSEQSIEKK
ncbi:FAD-dependent oxidoreductase [Sinorhizobium meliloti]|uniref:FAD/NAD(P)-dependent oxidoreductase n=1 Tax=Rhizobium meliloti TaxID=382 RepID=UPI000FDCDA93|nr:NAD(P)/FAD-dependent oxidoreductase [Sinorhizobium meliloti]RVH62699.1 FAD-dependent oxidoreductase [Sinorhizobium meliloti]RVK62839.1 FAD-dependent oxidoreductase [Sinorhizobium meliloti]